MTQRGGGSYSVTDSGDLVQVEKPTRDHPEGNRPRDADGVPIGTPPLNPRPSVAPPPERPRGGPRRLDTVKE